MRKSFFAASLPLALLLPFAASAVGSPVRSLPACTGYIDQHTQVGCRMHASTFSGAMTDSTLAQPAVVRAIVPQGAAALGGSLNYAVDFTAEGLFRDLAAPAPLSMRVRIWLANDQNEHAVELAEQYVPLPDGSGAGTYSLRAAGKDIGFEPHYVYVSFTPYGPLNPLEDDVPETSNPATIGNVEIGIGP